MALTLPYPSMNFVPLDILTAQQQNQLVANIQYIANQFPVSASNIASGQVLKIGNLNITRSDNLNNIGSIFNSSYKDGYYTFNSWSGSSVGTGQPPEQTIGTLYVTSSAAWNVCNQVIFGNNTIYYRRYSSGVWLPWNMLVENRYKTVRLEGNATSYTTNIYMLPGKSDGFIHQFTVSAFETTPQMFQVMWTKNTSVRQCANLSSGGLSATITVNSFDETNATVNITLTFSSTVYGGIGIVSLG